MVQFRFSLERSRAWRLSPLSIIYAKLRTFNGESRVSKNRSRTRIFFSRTQANQLIAQYDWITAQPEVESDGPNIATMILPGETEAGSAGTQSCRGITWWSYRSLENPCPRGRILSNGERPPSISG